MAAIKHSTLVAVFNTREAANHAVDELQRAGFTRDQISVVAQDADGKARAQKTDGEDTYAGEGAAIGAATGAGVGALVSLGMTFGVIPFIGPVLAVGPLAAALISAVGGAAAASLTGALIGWGIPEEDAKYYESEVKAGRYLVTLHAEGRNADAWTILRRHGGYDRSSAAASSTTTAGDQHMQVREEQLNVHKQPVQTGEVKVRKEVVTEHKTIDVPVQREEVVIERHPVSGRAATSSDLKAGEEIRIPVKEEQVHVEKETVVKEEVSVGKRKVQGTEHVSGTVRKEQVRVEEAGDVKVQGNVSSNKKSK